MHEKALVTDYKLKVKGTQNIYAIGYVGKQHSNSPNPQIEKVRMREKKVN
jgi:hypothetical protein